MRQKGSAGMFLRGVAMGMADIVPGVSGGTIALITGIYERLVKGISDLKLVRPGKDQEEARKGWKMGKVDLELFLPLIPGIVLAVILMSSVITYLLDNLASPTYAFFFALILTSALILMKEKGILTWANGLSMLLGFLMTFLLVGSGALELGHSLPVIFLSGVIAICAMILPGISGALILLFLGQYEYMLNVLKTLVWSDILAFCFGAGVGILAFSRVLSHLLKNYRLQTVSFLIGLMLGCLRLPYENIIVDSNTIFPVMLAGLIGFFIIFFLEMEMGRARRRKSRGLISEG